MVTAAVITWMPVLGMSCSTEAMRQRAWNCRMSMDLTVSHVAVTDVFTFN